MTDHDEEHCHDHETVDQSLFETLDTNIGDEDYDDFDNDDITPQNAILMPPPPVKLSSSIPLPAHLTTRNPKIVHRDEDIDFTPIPAPQRQQNRRLAKTQSQPQVPTSSIPKHGPVPVRREHMTSHQQNVAPAPAPAPTPTKDSVVKKQKRNAFEKIKRICAAFFFAVTVIAIIGICITLVVMYYESASSFVSVLLQRRAETTFVPVPITPHIPASQCFVVETGDIISNLNDNEWQFKLRSMRHHMKTEQLDGISAFHIGDATCFMMVRMEDGSILEMYNPQFRAYSTASYSRQDEYSVACPEIKRTLQRANTIVMSFQDAVDGSIFIQKFNTTQARTIQMVGFYLKGKTICEMNAANTDYGLRTLKEEIERI